MLRKDSIWLQDAWQGPYHAPGCLARLQSSFRMLREASIRILEGDPGSARKARRASQRAHPSLTMIWSWLHLTFRVLFRKLAKPKTRLECVAHSVVQNANRVNAAKCKSSKTCIFARVLAALARWLLWFAGCSGLPFALFAGCYGSLAAWLSGFSFWVF